MNTYFEVFHKKALELLGFTEYRYIPIGVVRRLFFLERQFEDLSPIRNQYDSLENKEMDFDTYLGSCHRMFLCDKCNLHIIGSMYIDKNYCLCQKCFNGESNLKCIEKPMTLKQTIKYLVDNEILPLDA